MDYNSFVENNVINDESVGEMFEFDNLLKEIKKDNIHNSPETRTASGEIQKNDKVKKLIKSVSDLFQFDNLLTEIKKEKNPTATPNTNKSNESEIVSEEIQKNELVKKLIQSFTIQISNEDLIEKIKNKSIINEEQLFTYKNYIITLSLIENNLKFQINETSDELKNNILHFSELEFKNSNNGIILLEFLNSLSIKESIELLEILNNQKIMNDSLLNQIYISKLLKSEFYTFEYSLAENNKNIVVNIYQFDTKNIDDYYHMNYYHINSIIKQNQKILTEKSQSDLHQFIFKQTKTNSQKEYIKPQKSETDLKYYDDVLSNFNPFNSDLSSDNKTETIVNKEYGKYCPFLEEPKIYNYIETINSKNTNVFEKVNKNDLNKNEKSIYDKYTLDKTFKTFVDIIEDEKNKEIEKINIIFKEKKNLLESKFYNELVKCNESINSIITYIKNQKKILKEMNDKIKNWIDIYNSNNQNKKIHKDKKDVYNYYNSSNIEIDKKINELVNESNLIIKNLNDYRIIKGFNLLEDYEFHNEIETLIIENNNIISQKLNF
jgi:hypothetical protein